MLHLTKMYELDRSSEWLAIKKEHNSSLILQADHNPLVSWDSWARSLWQHTGPAAIVVNLHGKSSGKVESLELPVDKITTDGILSTRERVSIGAQFLWYGTPLLYYRPPYQQRPHTLPFPGLGRLLNSSLRRASPVTIVFAQCYGKKTERNLHTVIANGPYLATHERFSGSGQFNLPSDCSVHGLSEDETKTRLPADVLAQTQTKETIAALSRQRAHLSEADKARVRLHHVELEAKIRELVNGMHAKNAALPIESSSAAAAAPSSAAFFDAAAASAASVSPVPPSLAPMSASSSSSSPACGVCCWCRHADLWHGYPNASHPPRCCALNARCVWCTNFMTWFTVNRGFSPEQQPMWIHNFHGAEAWTVQPGQLLYQPAGPRQDGASEDDEKAGNDERPALPSAPPIPTEDSEQPEDDEAKPRKNQRKA